MFDTLEKETIKITAEKTKIENKLKDKIKKIFLYRIPYFVGPLAGANGWAVRKAEGKILRLPLKFKENRLLPLFFD